MLSFARCTTHLIIGFQCGGGWLYRKDPQWNVYTDDQILLGSRNIKIVLFLVLICCVVNMSSKYVCYKEISSQQCRDLLICPNILQQTWRGWTFPKTQSWFVMPGRWKSGSKLALQNSQIPWLSDATVITESWKTSTFDYAVETCMHRTRCVSSGAWT